MDDKKHIELLETIIELQRKHIAELERRPHALFPQLPQISIPSVWQVTECPMGNGPCDYLYPWNSTTPQPCKKCGKQAPTLTVTSQAKLGGS